ncbi:MAG: DUF1698 domain-containing protein [Pirellulaceae bacterium]
MLRTTRLDHYESDPEMTEAELQERIGQYKFYHTIKVTDAISTPGAPEHTLSQQPVLAEINKLDLAGKKVLDVGCRDGLYSFLAERRAQRKLWALITTCRWSAVELLIPYLKLQRMHQMNLLDLKPETFGQFDVVIFVGVLYHLRYPFWSLKLLRDVMRPGSMMVLETAVFYGQDKFPMLYCPTGRTAHTSLPVVHSSIAKD